ncbi:hypothetical protein K8Q94_00505 [Candidatus Nomurabacteria bacterium]|nr:hypothetical protein [Candidatus Nomurabacteria bacterium]
MSKSEADWCKKIEIWWLLRDIKKYGGYKHTTVSWGENGSRGSVSVQVSIWDDEKYARFIYTQTDNATGEKKDFDYKVPIVESPCHFGGTRHWFICTLSKNGQYCGRRVGVLYKDGDWFGCRHCYELTYSSRKVNKKYHLYPLLHTIELYDEIEKLSQKAKRQTYRGEPTKKQKKIERMYGEVFTNYKMFKIAENKLNTQTKGRNK